MRDILIKGMEMPKDCNVCNFHMLRFCCAADKDLAEKDTRPLIERRPEFCPLVPVPPHGRLIDADALIEESGLSTSPDSCEGCQHKNGNRCDGYEWAMLCEALSDAPTIIPAEEGE